MKNLIWTLLILPIVAFGQDFEVNLSWEAPTENVDDSPLTDLAGYTVYWGTSVGVYSDERDVPCAVPGTLADCVVDMYVVDDAVMLPNTTYYFVMTSYNEAGLESDVSNVVNYTTPNTLPPNEPTILNVTIVVSSG
jgi:hypothetical protein